MEVVLRHAVDPHTLFLFGAYSIGKERVFMEVARVLREPVCVSKGKLKLVTCFGWPLEVMVSVRLCMLLWVICEHWLTVPCWLDVAQALLTTEPTMSRYGLRH